MSTSDPLWGLLYTSTATRPMTEADLDALLEEAQARNEALGVTGWLTYVAGEDGEPGTFTQYVEGPESVIRRLFYGDAEPGTTAPSIHDDPRHRDVVVIQEGAFGGGPPGCRLHPDWFMEWVDAPEYPAV